MELKIFLCFWHVQRAWPKQSCVKIKNPITGAVALKALGNIMYNTTSPDGLDMDPWAHQELQNIMLGMPMQANEFRVYIREEWLP